MAHASDPGRARPGGLVGAAARHETAHGVPDQGYLLDLDRPPATIRREEVGERAAVLRDVQAGVEAELERGPAGLAREPLAVAFALRSGARPAPSPSARGRRRRGAAGAREGGGERYALRRDGAPADADGHRRGELRSLRLQGVAASPLITPRANAPRGLPTRRARRRAVAGAERDVRRQPGGGQATAHRAVDAAGDRVVGELDRPGGGAQRPNTRAATAAWTPPMPPVASPQLAGREPGERADFVGSAISVLPRRARAVTRARAPRPRQRRPRWTPRNARPASRPQNGALIPSTVTAER